MPKHTPLPQEIVKTEEGKAEKTLPVTGQAVSAEIQQGYMNIYVDKIIGGLSDAAIASSRKMSIQDVQKAIKQCRMNRDFSTTNQLIDAINVCDYRIHSLVAEQDRLRSLRYGLFLSARASGEDKLLYKGILAYEDRIQWLLEKKLQLEQLLQQRLE